MKKWVVAASLLALPIIIFAMKGQHMEQVTLSKDELFLEVEKHLNRNLYEPASCPAGFSKVSKNPTRCFKTHFQYREAIESIAESLSDLVTDKKTPWYAFGLDWGATYIYRVDKKSEIVFGVLEIASHSEKSNDPEFKDFSTFVWYEVFKEE